MASVKKRTGWHELVRQSVILHFLAFLGDSVMRYITSSFAAFLLTGDGKKKDSVESSRVFALCNGEKLHCKKDLLLPAKRRCAADADRSRIRNGLDRLMRLLFDLPLFFYGVALFSFGLYTVIFRLFLRYGMGTEELDREAMELGISLAVIFFPTLFSSKPLCTALGESRIGHFLLCTVLGYRERSLVPEKHPVPRASVPMMIGIGLGLLTLLVPSETPLLLPAVMIAVYLILKRPETGVILLFGLVPFLPADRIVLLILLTDVSYLLKLLCGKRSFTVIPTTIAMGGFLLLLLIGGVDSLFPSHSTSQALLYAVLLSAVFPVLNTVRSVAAAKRCAGALLFSGSVAAAKSLYDVLLAPRIAALLGVSLPSSGGIGAAYGGAALLGALLVLIFPFALGALRTSGRARDTVNILFVCVLFAACLILTKSRGAWLGAIVGLVLYTVLVSRRSVPLLVLIGCACPLLQMLIPASLRSALIGDGGLLSPASDSGLLRIWRGCCGMLKDYFVTGIGTGTSAFREVYAAYALPGAEEAADSGSLFFEIGIEHGLFGVILFGLVLFFAARVSFSFLASPPLPEDRENRVRTCAGIAGITAFLVVGLQCYVWSDPRVFCLFWMTLALVPDIAVCAKRDRITHIPDDDLLPEE